MMKRKLSKQAHPSPCWSVVILPCLAGRYGTHPLTSSSPSAQILTAQFREMEQELAEAVKRREEEKQQWAEETDRAQEEASALRSALESELVSLREAERVSQEALEREKLEAARLDSQVVRMEDAMLASQEASERAAAELARLENELASMREAADRACQGATEREKLEVEKLERELASRSDDAQMKGEMLAEVWRHLQSLAAEDVAPTDDPADLSLFLMAVQSVETQLRRLRDDGSEGRKRCDQLSHAVDSLQGEEESLTHRTRPAGDSL